MLLNDLSGHLWPIGFGAHFHIGRTLSSCAKTEKVKKLLTDRPTDRTTEIPANQPTDRSTLYSGMKRLAQIEREQALSNNNPWWALSLKAWGLSYLL